MKKERHDKKQYQNPPKIRINKFCWYILAKQKIG